MDANINAIVIKNTTKVNLPRLNFEIIKNNILGNNYVLDLTFIGDCKAKTLNKLYKNVDTPACILSFSINSDFGEIYINLPLAKKYANLEKIDLKNRIGFLYIHGILHLNGHLHGKNMEALEDKYTTLYNFV